MKVFGMLAAVAVSILCLPAQAFDIDAMSEAERDAFRGEVRAYLMENPEVLMEAIEVLQDREAAAKAAGDAALIEQNRAAIFDDGRSWVGGNPDGDVTLVEFMDYRCSYCRRAFAEVTRLLESDGNIRFVLKEFPILGEESLLASRFAIAARNVAGDDAYKAVHDAMIAHRAPITEAALERIAADAGLDADPILSAMDAPEVAEEIRANHDLARALQINGTPGFVLGDQVLRGFLPEAQMRDRIAQLRAQE